MFAMDIDEMKKLLQRVSKLNGNKYILSAHSGFTADFQSAIKVD
jgi:hypothetical protein